MKYILGIVAILLVVGLSVNSASVPLNPIVINGSETMTQIQYLELKSLLEDIKLSQSVQIYNISKRFDKIEQKQTDIEPFRVVVNTENQKQTNNINDIIKANIYVFAIVSVFSVLFGFSSCLLIFRNNIFAKNYVVLRENKKDGATK